MQLISDLQLHSKYSRATSSKMDLFEISKWASKKGIGLVATGDWTHPLWLREIKAHLKENAPGIFTLRQKPKGQKRDVSFLLSTEISSIYSQGGAQRRVHNLIFSPSLTTCDKIIKKLQNRGANLMSDGRPIVGLSSRELLEIALAVDERILFIPAHVWTPWFSLFGSRSGFDSIEECFGDLAQYVYAIETGLSSDPLMNWSITELDNRSIVSFSDAHSGPKLGREATVFSCNMKHVTCNIAYADVADAIKQKTDGHLKIAYTIEFFPEEGKYHWSGHRNCDVRRSTEEIKKKGATCPICNKPLTIGVGNRVLDLSSRTISEDGCLFVEDDAGLTFVHDKEKRRKPFVSAIPLLEILGEIEKSPTKALAKYERLIEALGSEFEILLSKPYEKIENMGGTRLKEAIKNVRKRRAFVDPGYDGVFGKVSVFGEREEKRAEEQQTTLF